MPRPGLFRPVAVAAGERSRLGTLLVEDGVITPDALDAALADQRRGLCRLGDLLIRRGLVTENDVYDALARQADVPRWDPASAPAAPDLIDRLGAAACARDGCLPLAPAGAITPIATCNPQAFASWRARVAPTLGPVAMVIASRTQLDNALLETRANALVRAAESVPPADLSCRSFGTSPLRRRSALTTVLAAIAGVAALGVAYPVAVFAALSLIAMVLLTLNTALLVAGLAGALRPTPSSGAGPSLARLPRVSLLVPLFHECRIADTLVRRLSLLDYPSELLEICLVTEASDSVTAAALAQTVLPDHMRVVVVPDGTVKTKPRAMNFALPFCNGDVIGIYDAEDAPPADQLHRVVERFAACPPDVGCLQARLNFYNPRASWLSRCFCVDYATWFALVLPALRKLGWPIPLGGTSVFFRRDVLDRVGAWDAHNVTEDADLGLRLARFGYRVELLRSTTLEEAPFRPRAWICQRSRWQKGYALTWAVHMRAPRKLWRDLGAWRFFGAQVLLLGALGGAVMAPVLWSFGLLWLGLPHPLSGQLTGAAQYAVSGLLFWGVAIQALGHWVALSITGRHRLRASIPLMPVYAALSTVSIAKALYEVAARPFFWDKTEHGISPPGTTVTGELHDPSRA